MNDIRYVGLQPPTNALTPPSGTQTEGRHWGNFHPPSPLVNILTWFQDPPAVRPVRTKRTKVTSWRLSRLPTPQHGHRFPGCPRRPHTPSSPPPLPSPNFQLAQDPKSPKIVVKAQNGLFGPEPPHPGSFFIVPTSVGLTHRQRASASRSPTMSTDYGWDLLLYQLMCIYSISINVLEPRWPSSNLSQPQCFLRKWACTRTDDVHRCPLIGLTSNEARAVLLWMRDVWGLAVCHQWTSLDVSHPHFYWAQAVNVTGNEVVWCGPRSSFYIS